MEKTTSAESMESSSALKVFESQIEVGSLILVIEGNAELVSHFNGHGYRVTALEGDAANLASVKVPEDIKAIWAGAAFTHCSESELAHQLEILRLILPDRGVLFLSLAKGVGELREQGEVTPLYSEEALQSIFKEKLFEIIKLEDSGNLLTVVATQ